MCEVITNGWLGLLVRLAALFRRSSDSSPRIILDVMLFRFALRVSVIMLPPGISTPQNPDLAIAQSILVMNSER